MHQNDNFIVMSSRTERLTRHHNKVVILKHLLVFYKDIYQNALSNHQESAIDLLLITFCQNIRNHILEEDYRHSHRREILKPQL
jgi:hypothetical protein